MEHRLQLPLSAQPVLLWGEKPSEFKNLWIELTAALEPRDAIEQIYLHDFVARQWEVLQWRRLKSCTINAFAADKIVELVAEHLPQTFYAKRLTRMLAAALVEHFDDENKSSRASKLARRGVEGDMGALNEIDKILEDDDDNDMPDLIGRAKIEAASQLLKKYGKNAKATKRIDGVLAAENTTFDDLTAQALASAHAENFTLLEQLDRLCQAAENCRNSALREMDRYRAAFAQAVRSSVKAVENGQFRAIEGSTPRRHASS